MTAQAGSMFERLVNVMQALRSPQGCPWDRAQTFQSLKPFVLEEAYEVLDAIDSGDPDELKQEIGDFLFEAVFLAQIAAEAGHFTISDSLAAIVDKLIRRHPHVFGAGDSSETRPVTPGDVVERWEALKARERTDSSTPQTLLSGIPRSLPALLRAYEIGARAAAVGFDWPRAAHVLDKIDEETAELREVVACDQGADRLEEEIGDLLFAIANLFRKLGVEPEAALRRANDKFTSRFVALERSVRSRGHTFNSLSLDELEAEWQQNKRTGADTQIG